MKGRIRRLGEDHVLLIPRQHGQPSALPLRTKGSYLGAVISYYTLEHQSWIHRKRTAWLAFHRLRNWLRHRDIAVRRRLYLWKQCVFTVMTYSILATNVTAPILHDFQATIYRMIRIIIGDHSYRTHHTHQQVFRHFQIEHPLDMLSALAMSLQHRLHRRAIGLPSSDFLSRVDWTSLTGTIQLIACIRASDVEVTILREPTAPVLTQAMLSCPCCDFCTTSVANLRRHLTSQHGIRQYRTASTAPAIMALQGAPQCSRCFQVFTTWNSFHIHVQRNCCQVMHDPAAMPPSRTAAAGPDRSSVSMPVLPGATTLSFHVMQQAFWPELMIQLTQADWLQFPRNADMLEYLAHHCAICGLWCNRFQELHGHFRQAHSTQAQGSVAEGVQISQIMQITSPCSLCQRPYSRVHSCPVTLQLGMLMIQVRPPDDRSAVACACDICALPFQDLGQLYGHLTNCHGLTVNDWCPSRDSHQGGDGCRHCGLIFDSRSGLRRHITEGRCEAFNPLATPHPNDTTDKWGSWLQTGDFAPASLTAHMRLQLSNTCQFCGLAYSRTGDLVAHLLQSHGDLWTESQPWLRFLLQAVMARRGCLCNPQCNELGLTHVCALFRQVAMMIHSQDIQLLVPTQFRRSDLEATLLCMHHEVFQRRVIQTMVDRDFTQLWQDPVILEGLRTRCLTCGGHYNTAVLLHHLLVQHPQTCAWAAQMAFQLHQLLQVAQTTDYQCNLCEQVFNMPVERDASMTPERCRLQHQHFTTNCPVALQIAVLLHPLHGLTDGPQGSGLDGWPPGSGAPSAGSQKTLGWKRRSSAQTSQSSVTRRRLSGVSAGRGHDHGSTADGPADSEPREIPAVATPTGLLRFVCPRPTGGHHTTPEGDGSEVERRSSEARGRPEMAQPTHSPDGGSRGGASSSSSTAGGIETRRPTVGPCGGERNASSRWELGLPEMVSRVEATEAGTTGTPIHATAAEESQNAGGAPAVEQPRSEVPQPEDGSVHHSMDTPDIPSGFRCLVSATRPLPEHSVVPVRDVGQTAQHGPFETGAAASTNVESSANSTGEGTREGEGLTETPPTDLSYHDRQRLRNLLLGLQLDNSGSSCYANSAFLAYVWACLSRRHFQYLDWGAQSATLQAILFENDGSPFSLEAQDWFPQLLSGWNEQQGQADSAEFGHRLANWLNVSALSNRWERRVVTSDAMTIHDHGATNMPLTLQLDPAMISDNEISLTALLRLWSAELAMCAGLTDPRELLVIHVDRLVMSPAGTLYKHDAAITFAWDIQVPVLGEGTDLRHEPYTIVAVTARLGTTLGGHYQTMLRTYPEVSDLTAPSMWMFCDDCRLPERCWVFPDNFSQGITDLWLCRTAALEMHLMNQPRQVPAHDLLAVLQAQPSLTPGAALPHG